MAAQFVVPARLFSPANPLQCLIRGCADGPYLKIVFDGFDQA